jgi:hypothetical protein
MITADRVAKEYFLRLVRDHAYSNHVRNYLISGIEPRKLDWARRFRARLRGLKNGSFSMECMLAEWGGEDQAARFIASKRLVGLRVKCSPAKRHIDDSKDEPSCQKSWVCSSRKQDESHDSQANRDSKSAFLSFSDDASWREDHWRLDPAAIRADRFACFDNPYVPGDWEDCDQD